MRRTGTSALALLALLAAGAPSVVPPEPRAAVDDVTAAELRRHVGYLASEALEGRLTGTPGERRATRYVAAAFRVYGLAPASDAGTFFQGFDFTAGVSLGSGNVLRVLERGAPAAERWTADVDWRPLAFSRSGTFDASGIVFAGYGIVAPAVDDQAALDAFAGLDVRDRWVLVLRYAPEDVAPDVRRHLLQFANVRYKTMVARERGARGVLVATGLGSRVRDQLVPLSLRAYLGTVPDYAASDVVGVRLTSVARGAPADGTGVHGGDVVVQLGATRVENLYDYTYALDRVKIGEPVPLIVERGGARITVTVVPASRQ